MTAVDKILTGRDVLGCGVREFVEKVWEGRGKTFEMPTKVARGAECYAMVNAAELRYPGNWHGRWVVVCPDCGTGCEYVDSDSAIFFCLSCYNIGTGGQWRAVVFPQERALVEELLLKRPGQYQNFLPGETIDDLRTQNAVIEQAA